MRFLGLKNVWPFTERIALLCKKVQKTAEKYDAVLASVAAGPKLLAIAKALQDNSIGSLAAAAAAQKKQDRLVAKLPIQHEVDGIVVAEIFNGFTADQAKRFAGMLHEVAAEVGVMDWYGKNDLNSSHLRMPPD